MKLKIIVQRIYFYSKQSICLLKYLLNEWDAAVAVDFHINFLIN